MLVNYLETDDDRFLSHSFQFIIQQLFYYATLYTLLAIASVMKSTRNRNKMKTRSGKTRTYIYRPVKLMSILIWKLTKYMEVG